MDAPGKDVHDYLAQLRRRKTLILTVAAALFSASTALAFLLPAVYRSTATILIEEQEIPMFFDAGAAWNDNRSLQLFTRNEYGKVVSRDLLMGMGTARGYSSSRSW